MTNIAIHDLAITVVEPSAVQAQIIAGHLRTAGVRDVQAFHTGADVLAHLERFKSDLVISAMYLPDMTGAELVQHLRTSPYLEDLPFMLISSETSFAMLDPIRQAGVVAILPKPFAPQDLRRALFATLEFVNPDVAALADVVLDDLKVLVVDDSSTARKHIVRVLNNLGLENITTAENGRAAVELIEHNFFDLVVTDYNMPEMDGEMLTRHIREHSSQRSIPVLMVTSEGDSSRLAAVQQAGVSGICDKPFDAITVKQMIRNLLTE
ncbi:MAG TPA: response regulator [Gammaproteobacteria bacterium]|jgi:two-component system chemotaxis response regulator CheY|nr:response regulator [Gammaproteobacteria bacterium]